MQVMLSPTANFSVASLIGRSRPSKVASTFEISDTCSRPSTAAPMSTKAP